MPVDGSRRCSRTKLQGQLRLGALAVPLLLEVTFSETLVQGEYSQHWQTNISLPTESWHHELPGTETPSPWSLLLQFRPPMAPLPAVAHFCTQSVSVWRLRCFCIKSRSCRASQHQTHYTCPPCGARKGGLMPPGRASILLALPVTCRPTVFPYSLTACFICLFCSW